MKILGPHSTVGLGFAAATVVADQLHKLWMIGLFDADRNARITVAPFFDLVLVWNRGISYGLFKQDSDAGRFALFGFSVLATLALTAWLANMSRRLPAACLGLIIGGALGNAIDRLHYGAVADFFSFHVAGFHWYVFNLADVAIVAGVAGLLYDSAKSSHKSVGNQA
jgi:signal peptidase II